MVCKVKLTLFQKPPKLLFRFLLKRKIITTTKNSFSYLSEPILMATAGAIGAEREANLAILIYFLTSVGHLLLSVTLKFTRNALNEGKTLTLLLRTFHHFLSNLTRPMVKNQTFPRFLAFQGLLLLLRLEYPLGSELLDLSHDTGSIIRAKPPFPSLCQ